VAHGALRTLFGNCPETNLHLFIENVSGPWERLLDGDADLIFHHIDKTDTRLEFIDLFPIQMIPVVAPSFLTIPVTDSITPEQMRDYVQCVLRDTARHSVTRNYAVVDGARNWTVNSNLTKREIILQGMGWGHLPTFLIEEELRNGRLIPITGQYFKGVSLDIVAARRRDAPHGPTANRIWQFIGEQRTKFLRLMRKKVRIR
jgi:DNA-binding transcriptional LysR family regulator